MLFVNALVGEIANERRLLLNKAEQDGFARNIVDEMVGLGPIEPLIQDPTVSDILVNGPDMIYVERRGKLELTEYKFRHNDHVMHVAQRIASSVGRAIDEVDPHARRQAVRWKPRQRRHPAARPERAVPLHPQVFPHGSRLRRFR